MKIKFENANIVTCNNNFDIVKGDLVVCDGIIESVGANIQGDFDRVINCNDGILLPGLINCYANLNLWQYKGKILRKGSSPLRRTLYRSRSRPQGRKICLYYPSKRYRRGDRRIFSRRRQNSS